MDLTQLYITLKHMAMFTYANEISLPSYEVHTLAGQADKQVVKAS